MYRGWSESIEDTSRTGYKYRSETGISADLSTKPAEDERADSS